jgi:hypothetical protein
MAMLTSLVGGLLLAGGVACAGSTPAKNVSAHRHPNLAAAQKLSSQAYQKLVAAQVANEWDLGGHAEKAKALLQQANDEMKLAAEAANGNWK